MYLVRQDKVQNFFIKFIFGRKAKVLTNLKGINATTLTESASFISDANTGKIKYFIVPSMNNVLIPTLSNFIQNQSNFLLKPRNNKATFRTARKTDARCHKIAKVKGGIIS